MSDWKIFDCHDIGGTWEMQIATLAGTFAILSRALTSFGEAGPLQQSERTAAITEETVAMASTLIADLLAALDRLVGGPHAGFRPVHAKGVICSGTFTPSPDAAKLTRAPHALRPATPVTVRFSVASGVPSVAENDPLGSSPQGIAVRFHLAEHVHTDIIAHSHNGFPTRTGEEFLEFLHAAAASGPGAASPPPIVAFLAAHPAARKFAETPKPIPSSYARQTYFAVTAFKFISASGDSRFGRFRLVPDAGNEPLTTEQAAGKSADFLDAELTQRLTQGPIGFRVLVQLAEAGDEVADSTAVWTESRTQFELGRLTITKRENENEPELRKIIFDPVPRVDGIDSAGDPLTEVRSDLYLLSGRRRRGASK